MKTSKLIEENGEDFLRIFLVEDVEFVNPIIHFKNIYINKTITTAKDLMLRKNPIFLSEKYDEIYYNLSLEKWKKEYEEIKNTPIHENFLNLLSSKSKNEQVKLLKNQSLTPKQLLSFICIAWNEFGYTYSQYRTEIIQNGINKEELPILARVDEVKIIKNGNTLLSNGQLKQVIEHRKVTIAKFFDKNESWHCLFITQNSIKGRENWKNGQAHYHYLSNKYGIPRNKVVERLQSNNYPSTSVHIKLLEYGKQT